MAFRNFGIAELNGTMIGKMLNVESETIRKHLTQRFLDCPYKIFCVQTLICPIAYNCYVQK